MNDSAILFFLCFLGGLCQVVKKRYQRYNNKIISQRKRTKTLKYQTLSFNIGCNIIDLQEKVQKYTSLLSVKLQKVLTNFSPGALKANIIYKNELTQRQKMSFSQLSAQPCSSVITTTCTRNIPYSSCISCISCTSSDAQINNAQLSCPLGCFQCSMNYGQQNRTESVIKQSVITTTCTRNIPYSSCISCISCTSSDAQINNAQLSCPLGCFQCSMNYGQQNRTESVIKQKEAYFTSKIDDMENQLKLNKSIIVGLQQNQKNIKIQSQIINKQNQNLKEKLRQCQQKLELKQNDNQILQNKLKRLQEYIQDQVLHKDQKQKQYRKSQFSNQFQQFDLQRKRQMEKDQLDFESRSNQSICENKQRIMQKIEYQFNKVQQKVRQIKYYIIKQFKKKQSSCSINQKDSINSQRFYQINASQMQQYEQQKQYSIKFKEESSSKQNQLYSRYNSSFEQNIYPSQKFSEESSIID